MSALDDGASVLWKEEPQWDDGADEAAAGVFAEYEVKNELVPGPERLQPQDIDYALFESSEATAGAVTGAQSAAAGAEDARSQGARGRAALSALRPGPAQLETNPDDTFTHKTLLKKNRLNSPMCAQSDGVTLSSNCGFSDKRNHYLCDNCGSKFSSKTYLIRHLQRYEQKPYMCKVCEKLFTNLSALQYHQRDHFTCRICQKEFKNKSHFIKHNIIHSTGKYSCDICYKAYKRRETLMKHLLNHNLNTRCDICNQSFPSRLQLNKHVIIYTGSKPHQCEICKKQFHSHPDGKSYACETCSKSLRKPEDQTDSEFACFVCKKAYKYLPDLYQHAQIHKVACTVCKKEFTRRRLRRHMRIHSELKPYPCGVCKKGFQNNNSLAEHMLIHTGLKPHRCDICNKQFRRRQTFDEHMLHHSHPEGKPYACDICSKAWSSRVGWRVHMQSHSGVKFVCDVCKKEYSYRSSLVKHIKIHSKVKPYSCDICKKSFIRRSLLSTHMFTHTRVEQRRYMRDEQFRLPSALNDHKLRHSLPNNRPFACDICNKTYMRPTYLWKHKQTHSEAKFVCDVCKKSFRQRSILITHMKIHFGN